jgi:calcineurin-like phosphoesterase family protein
MSHFPLADAHSGDKQRLLLHGHSHGLLQHNNYFMHDVGVDAHHYYPFTIDWLDRERLLEKLNSTSERGTRCSYMLSHKPEEVQ